MTGKEKIIGLTGGIGSGKSVAGAWFRQWGASVVDADTVAREVVEPGSETLEQLVTLVGSWCLGDDGELDRGKLAARMFADLELKKSVEGILHPAIEQRVRQLLAELPLPVVYEAPLLLEAGHDQLVSLVVVVTAPEDQRVARVMARDGVEEAAVKARMAAQWTDEQRLAKAEVELVNAGDLALFLENARRFWDDWTSGRPLARRYD